MSLVLSEHARSLLENFYKTKGETSPEHAFRRAAVAFCAGDLELAERMVQYTLNGWFMFSSPILSNARLEGEPMSGLPISCFLSYVDDSLEGLIDHSTELRWMSVKGGGVGGHWSDVRTVSDKAPGPIPFLKTVDSDMTAYRQGKCYHPDTEILTENGWVRFEDLTEGVKVAQVGDNLEVSFVLPLQLVKEQHEGSLLRVQDGTNVNVLVTPNHSMVVSRKVSTGWSDDLIKIQASDLPLHSEVRMFKGAYNQAVGRNELTPSEKLMVANQADGLKNRKGSTLEFHFKKQRKVTKLLSILQEGLFSYNLVYRNDGSVTIRVKTENVFTNPDFVSDSFDWVNPTTRTSEWLNAFLEEVSCWDSSKRTDTSFTYSNTNKADAEVVFLCATLCGKSAFIKEYARGGARQNHFTVHIHGKNHFTTQAVTITEEAYSGLVYCALVPTGRLMVRSNGRSLVCGNTRKGSYAAYLDVSHPDILEFLNLRVPTGGDENRKCFNLNNAVNLSDAFMNAVLENKEWQLIDPATKEVKETMLARELWHRILEVRFRTGEPYFFFSDTANKHLPQPLKDKGLKIHGSNLCNEVFLSTSKERSAVCCLSSVNLEYFDDWKNTTLVEDAITFLDNVLEYFIQHAPAELHKAIFSAKSERSLGLGTMGFHSYLQRKNIPFESPIAKGVNRKIFAHIKQKAVEQTERLAQTRGEYLDGIGTGRRNSHLMAIAPNANSAIILDTSPSIEPWKSNAFTHRTRAGSFLQKNIYLDAKLKTKGLSDEEYNQTWQSIILNRGSVQHLECLTEYEKAVFKTAFEIDQMWLIEHASDRQEFICQGQSLNLFFPAGSDKAYVNAVHLSAWKKGLKGLYYLRTETGVTGEKVSTKIERKALKDYDECISCQG